MREYALCLLSCGDLREKYGILTIPHWSKKPVSDYRKLLQGKAIEQVEHQQRAPMLQLEFPDDLAGGVDEEEALDAPSAELEDLLTYVLEHLDVEEEALIAHAKEQEDILAAPNLEEEEDVQEEDAEAQGPEHQEEAEVESTSQREPPRKKARQHGRLRNVPWGCFDIVRKKTKLQELAFEVRCPFHRLHEDHRCVKTISYSLATEEHSLSVARWWANQATYHNKQRDHMKCFKNILEVPVLPYDVLLQGQLTQKPSGPVLTDAEVDAIEARQIIQGHQVEDMRESEGEAEEEPQRRRPRGRGRARGRGARAASSSSATFTMYISNSLYLLSSW